MILLRNSETQKRSPPLRVGLPVTILSCSYIADIFQRSEAEVWQVLCQGLTNTTRGPTLQGKQTAEQIYGSLKHKVCKHSGKGHKDYPWTSRNQKTDCEQAASLILPQPQNIHTLSTQNPMGNTRSHGLEKQHLKKNKQPDTAACSKCCFPLSTAQGEKGDTSRETFWKWER